MSTQDQLLALVTAGLRGEDDRFRDLVRMIAANEKGKGRAHVAERLNRALAQARPLKPTMLNDSNVQGLLLEIPAGRNLESLVLPPEVRKACLDLAREHERAELLRQAGIEPRHRVLLEGPPGNGKTALAGALAQRLGLPLVVARYDSIISSYLGETLTKLRRIFDYASKRPCVLLLDELDTVGSERGSGNEVGEMRRAVTTLLTCLDEAPSSSVIVTATNHKEMLDRAIWRRFQVRLELPAPTAMDATDWLRGFSRRTGISFGRSCDEIAEAIGTTSFAELEEFCTSVQRRHLLEEDSLEPELITAQQLAEWNKRAVA